MTVSVNSVSGLQCKSMEFQLFTHIDSTSILRKLTLAQKSILFAFHMITQEGNQVIKYPPPSSPPPNYQKTPLPIPLCVRVYLNRSEKNEHT